MLRIIINLFIALLVIVFVTTCSNGAKEAIELDLIANAGSDNSVYAGNTIKLDASKSSPLQSVSYWWQQISGPTTLLEGTRTEAIVEITAPNVNTQSIWVFQFTIHTGILTAEDQVKITVEPNDPPSVFDVSIVDSNGGDTKVGDTLSGSYTFIDKESDVEGSSIFRWLLNGIEIVGAAEATYTLEFTDIGKLIAFEVTPVAATGIRIGQHVKSSSVSVLGTKPLNDTGILHCGDYAYTDTGTDFDVTGSGSHNNNLICGVQPVVPDRENDGSDADGDIIRGGQDALYGRDVTNNDSSDGHAGFSFTKIDSDGIPLVNQFQDYASNPWACVQDNVTGLIWEVKTAGGLQSGTHTYTWYNSTGINDGGEHGIGDTGVGTSTGYETILGTYPGSDNCADNTRCDTEKYTSDVNAINICGEASNDWRLPTRQELLLIVNNNVVLPSVDITYFPYINQNYWASSSDAEFPNQAIYVNLDYGFSDVNRKETNSYSILLVRNK